jgi:membrane associated rhomboid family serine protease/Zn-finger nucleic acid-binding protein
MGVGLLRRTIDERLVTAIWAQTYRATDAKGRPCAVCSKDTVQVEVEAQAQSVPLEVCKRCEFVWFDRGEFELMPPPKPKPKVLGEIDESTMSPEAREKLALARVKEIAEQSQATAGPDEEWKTIPGLFGLPVEMESTPSSVIPWATYITTGLIALVSLASFFDLKNIIAQWSLIPALPWRHGGLTFLTSFLLHGGPIHLFGNLYFLFVFGGHVENNLGWRRWLALLAAAALIGDVAHITLDPQSSRPMIGASGGISGLLAFYALKFPDAKLGILFRIYFNYCWIPLPAWTAFFIWILFQVWGSYEQVLGIGNVSSLAHLGGVAAGVAAWMAWRNPAVRPLSEVGPNSPTIG